MKLAAAIIALLLAGCTNHTAAIAHSAIDARQAVGAAIIHMDAAREQLDGLQTSIEAVQAHVAYVSDDENPIYATLKYVSVAGVVIGAFTQSKTGSSYEPRTLAIHALAGGPHGHHLCLRLFHRSHLRT
jgi:hypothetical protein